MNEQDLQAFFDRLSDFVGRRNAIEAVIDIRQARCYALVNSWDGNLSALSVYDKDDTMGALRHLQLQMASSGNPEYAAVADVLTAPTTSTYLQ